MRIGCAGWSIPKQHAGVFPTGGSHLARYAQRLNAAEINSSFYRPHRKATYERWAATVPPDFAFAVKAPREMTHKLRLADAEAPLAAFLDQSAGLGAKRGPLLFQLPPCFRFAHDRVAPFLATLRRSYGGDVAWEPRHASWFAPEADALLEAFRIARVAADPAVVPEAARPGGWTGLRYFRLHGSPQIYYSDYDPDRLEALARTLEQRDGSAAWCIFDNTARGAATANALALRDRLATA